MRMRWMGAALVMCVAALPACGGGGGGSSSSPPCPEGGSPRAAVNGAVTICAFDPFRYDVKEITAPAGPLKVTLINKGSTRHTFTLSKTNLDLVTPGKNDVADGTVTLEKGEYKFECTEDAHASAGMTGKIVVS